MCIWILTYVDMCAHIYVYMYARINICHYAHAHAVTQKTHTKSH